MFVCAAQVLLSRMAAKLGSAVQQEHVAAAAGVLAGAAAGVSAQLPQLSAGARLDIAAAVLGSGRHRRLIKSALHAIVAGSSRCLTGLWGSDRPHCCPAQREPARGQSITICCIAQLLRSS